MGIVREKIIKGTSNKGGWYRILIDKVDKAIENRYFFEAIFIEYMLIDDRIKSLAKLSGIDLNNEDSPKMLGQLIDELKAARKVHTLKAWELLDDGIPFANNKYLKAMKAEQYPKRKIEKVTHVPRMLINYKISPKGKYISSYGAIDDSILNQIKGWTNLRNHWMHAAGDDALTLEEYESYITPLAIDGETLARELCAITLKIKRQTKKMKKN